MKQELVDHQKSLMKTNKKLTFYSIFKIENKKAEFLDCIKNHHHKKIINKFLQGNHKFMIKNRNRQLYRHTVPKIPELHLRTCQICNTSKNLKCNAYNDICDKYFKEITGRYPVFDHDENCIPLQ